MKPNRAILKKGSSILLRVKREHIDISEPCKKDLCMLTMALRDKLSETYGRGNYYIKSTSTGVMFTLGNRRYTGLFPPATAKKIFHYDLDFKTSKDKAATRAAVKPFSSEVMIQSSIAKGPPASPERRRQLNENQTKKYYEQKAKGLKTRKYSGSREISL